MKTIPFDKNHGEEVFFYSKKKEFTVIKIHFFSTDNKDWISKINNATVFIKISALDKQYKELSSARHVLSLSSYITPYHVQPVFEVDQSFSFPDESSLHKGDKLHQWKVEITLNNIAFSDEESLSVLYSEEEA